MKQKRNTSDIEDTIDLVYSDMDNLLSQRKQQLLEMHENELQLVERENAYYKAKIDIIRNIEADHESRIDQYIQIMKEVENGRQEISKREAELMKREECLGMEKGVGKRDEVRLKDFFTRSWKTEVVEEERKEK